MFEHVRHARITVDFVHGADAQPQHVNRCRGSGIGFDDQRHAVLQFELLNVLGLGQARQKQTADYGQQAPVKAQSFNTMGFHRMT